MNSLRRAYIFSNISYFTFNIYNKFLLFVLGDLYQPFKFEKAMFVVVFINCNWFRENFLSFQHKTFVTSVNPGDTVARVRAQLLHILYELGKDDHTFRLRHKGQFLRDAFTLDDYQINDNSVLTMVPVGTSQEVRRVFMYLWIDKHHVINT